MPLQNIQQKVMTFCSARRRLTYAAAKWNVAAGRMLEKAAATRANAVACAGLAALYIIAKNASHPLAPTVMTKKRKVTNRARARSSTMPPSTRIAAAVNSVASASKPVGDVGTRSRLAVKRSIRQFNPEAFHHGDSENTEVHSSPIREQLVDGDESESAGAQAVDDRSYCGARRFAAFGHRMQQHGRAGTHARQNECNDAIGGAIDVAIGQRIDVPRDRFSMMAREIPRQSEELLAVRRTKLNLALVAGLPDLAVRLLDLAGDERRRLERHAVVR